MDVEATIVAKLTTDPAVAALIEDRIAQAGMPQRLARPNIVYQRIGTRRDYSNDGSTRAPSATLQLTCWADDQAGARALSNAVRTALDGFRGTVGESVIDAIFVSDENDAPVPQTPGKDQTIRGIVLDFKVHFRE